VVVELIQEHYVKVAVVLLAVAVVAVGSSYYQASQRKSAATASQLLYRGEDLLAKGSHVSAQASLQECIDRFGGTEFGKIAHVSLAKTMIAMGENEQALASAESSIAAFSQNDPQYIDLMLLKATALNNLKRYNEAIVEYRSLLEKEILDPMIYDVSLRLADCLHADGNTGEGLAVLEQLEQRIENEDLDLSNRNLESRIEFYRAFSK